MFKATARARRPWWNTVSACLRRWTTGRCASKSGEAVSPQTIFVSATPGPYEAEHAGRVIEQVVRPTGLVDPEIEYVRR